MVAKSDKNKKESLFFSILLGVLVFVVIGFLIVSNLRINQRRNELNSQLQSLQQELQALEAKKTQLESDFSESSEESYLEKEARERFNLKKPGEEVVAVLPAEEEEGGVEEKGFWQKIWDRIKF